MEVDASSTSTPRAAKAEPKSSPTSVKPGPTSTRGSSLHDVILDYISHSAYLDTARHLTTGRAPTSSGDRERNGGGGDVKMEMDTDTDGERGMARRQGLSEEALDSIEKRYNIMNSILDGAIVRAIEALNTHFPSVLSGPGLGSSGGSIKSSPTNGHTNGVGPGPGSSTSNGASAQMAPTNGHGHGHSNGTGTAADHTRPSFDLSSTPSHVLLNLHIQQFIESFRGLAPASTASPSSSSSLSSSFHGSQSFGADSTGTLQHALTAASGLHAEAGRLADPADRAVYVREITEAGALFAYSDPEASPVGGFLKQERRIRLAQQVNRAILKSTGHSSTSWLEEIARRTAVSYSLIEQGGNKRVSLTNDQIARLWKVGEKKFKLSDFIAQGYT